MPLPSSQIIPPGWQGGFAQSNPEFAYPDPNLSALPMLCNMDNICLLQRQQSVKWPEFSWETIPGDSSSRCFQMFAPYISQIGYTDKGRVYSIICPQQGVWLGSELCLNVEVTVTGQRGWVDEVNREVAADMTVEARVWFTHGQHQGPFFKSAWSYLSHLDSRLPMDKDHAIRVTTFKPGDPCGPILQVRKGVSPRFDSPLFCNHSEEAWAVAHIDVEIGPNLECGDPFVDDFNVLIMRAFNIGSGRLLETKNILSWNVWFASPQLVSQAEWKAHADFWRKSIDVCHRYPDGPGTDARYYNGSAFSASCAAVEEIIREIMGFIKSI